MARVHVQGGGKFTSCATAPGMKCTQTANHRFGRSIKCHWVHLRLVHTRVICPSGPILKDGRSVRGGGTALVGSTASRERGNAAMQHSGVSLTPAGGAMGHLRGPASILGQRHTYGLLKSRRAGPGDSNLTATACVQRASQRFFSGLCTVCGRHTRLCAASGPL